ncbi:site-specific integrase [Solibacillus sp. FSL R7-0682]|uniref:tyrosine-type recombinase/integrase n=1 Tax=Solibacillus sp. FSL R7-0682 TaxID=2921690 RepID=UPI0030F6E77D
MKNPNGYGSVFKLSGKRRKPFAVRVTAGYTDTGKQKYEYLGYYEKRDQAMMALAEYNKSPFDITKAKTTFAEVYDSMMKEKYPDGPNEKERSNWNGYNASYKSAERLHHLKFIDIRKNDLQEIITASTKSHGTKRKIKVLFNQMFKYAMEQDLVTKDYSVFVDVGKNDSGTYRKPFNDVEIKALWDNVERLEFIELILVLIYTGLRPGELLEVKLEDINIKERYLRGGFKTEAGTNRLIPLNKKILPFLEKRMNAQQYLVVNSKGQQMSYHNFHYDHFKKIMEQLKLEHKPHDCRHTFATLMDNADANKLSIKRIMGHASKDITDKVYTHKDITQLLAAIDLI